MVSYGLKRTDAHSMNVWNKGGISTSFKHTACQEILLRWRPRPRLFKLVCCKTFANEKDISAKFTGGTHLLRNQNDRAAWRSIDLTQRQYIYSFSFASYGMCTVYPYRFVATTTEHQKKTNRKKTNRCNFAIRTTELPHWRSIDLHRQYIYSFSFASYGMCTVYPYRFVATTTEHQKTNNRFCCSCNWIKLV